MRSVFFVLTGIIEAIWGLGQLYGVVLSRHGQFLLTGSFYNPGPYSGFLATIFPIAFYEWLRRRKEPKSIARLVKEWNGNRAVAKTCEWQSKVYVGSQFFRLTTCRVYADAYPVTLKIYMASSPDGIFSERARTTEVIIRNQDARRLPMIRPEKYFAFRVTGYARINHVGIASSMEALK